MPDDLNEPHSVGDEDLGWVGLSLRATAGDVSLDQREALCDSSLPSHPRQHHTYHSPLIPERRCGIFYTVSRRKRSKIKTLVFPEFTLNGYN